MYYFTFLEINENNYILVHASVAKRLTRISQKMAW